MTKEQFISELQPIILEKRKTLSERMFKIHKSEFSGHIDDIRVYVDTAFRQLFGQSPYSVSCVIGLSTAEELSFVDSDPQIREIGNALEYTYFFYDYDKAAISSYVVYRKP